MSIFLFAELSEAFAQPDSDKVYGLPSRHLLVQS